MKLEVVIIAYFLMFNIKIGFCLVDPISIGVGIGVVYGAFKYKFLKEQTYCRFTECCDVRSIPGDIYKLKKSLKEALFGQHIVLQQLIPALEAHFSPYSQAKKPLVISFHGTPGTGKNFVADHIAEALYTNGLQSKYVHKYMGRADFPLQSDASIYKTRIIQEVRDSIAECPRSLFIFDEVDKMPEGVFESLTSIVNYNSFDNKQDNSKAIFLFLSNTAGVHISDRLAELIKGGTLREESKLSHFEQTLEIAAYNLEGGMKKTSLIEAHAIDFFIPFLPLEKDHVKRCLEAEFKKWHKKPGSDKLDELLKDIVTYDRKYGLFATSGCKTLEKKVSVEVKSNKLYDY